MLFRHHLLSALGLGLCLSAGAQSPPPAEAAPADPGQRVERITHEDKLTRIDELRVGGQTQRIEVQPKNGAPAYEIAPVRSAEPPGQGAGERTGNGGKSSWRLFNF
jgi:starvation-inducible outer membrane lipoprotein